MEPREGIVLVASDNLEHQIVVTQEAGSESLFVTMDPETLSLPYTGGSRTLTLTSNTTWTLEASEIVAYLSPTSGNGNADLTIIVDGNASEEPRTGYVRASHNGQVMFELTIEQEGKPDLLEVDTEGIVAPAEGGEFTFHVTSNQGWTVSSDVLWATVAPTTGFGNGDVTVTFAPLNSTRPRTGEITVKADSGKKVIVGLKQQP